MATAPPNHLVRADRVAAPADRAAPASTKGRGYTGQPADLDTAIDGIVADMLLGKPGRMFHMKETPNTSLEIMGVGAMFRYHGQMNALGRLRGPAEAGPRGAQTAAFLPQRARSRSRFSGCVTASVA